ncbi:MAG: MFS transporter, partial [Lacticaseibacillus rhamnosus]
LIGGFVLFAGSFLILLNVSGQYLTFIVAMVVLTLGEILALPAVSTYVTLFTPLAQQGRYQGLIQGFASAGRALGPLLGAMVIEGTQSYRLLFVGATGLILLAVLGFAFTVRESIPALNDPLHPAAH